MNKKIWNNFFKYKKTISFYKKIIKNYLDLNKKFKFNQELNKKYIFKQILNAKKNKELKLLPIGIKDNINTEVLSTNFGLKSKKKFMIGNNARIVDKIIETGGIIFSKTTCAEFAVHHIEKKYNKNPYDFKHIAGTSSTGSAIAVATGALPVSIGTQTAGSIMRPASYCGIYGFKPTFGSIDRTGTLKTNDLFDTIGIFSSNIKFIELIFKNVRVNGNDYPWSRNFNENYKKYKLKKKINIGIINNNLNIFKNADENIKNFYQNVLSKLKKYNLSFIDSSNLNKFHYLHDMLYKKSVSYYLKNYTNSKKIISSSLKKMLLEGNKITTQNYNNKLTKLNKLIEIETKKLKKYDFVITPTTFCKAPLHSEKEKDDCCLIWTAMNMPCLNIPFFKKKETLPYGIMIASSKFNDFSLLEFSKDLSKLNIS